MRYYLYQKCRFYNHELQLSQRLKTDKFIELVIVLIDVVEALWELSSTELHPNIRSVYDGWRILRSGLQSVCSRIGRMLPIGCLPGVLATRDSSPRKAAQLPRDRTACLWFSSLSVLLVYVPGSAPFPANAILLSNRWAGKNYSTCTRCNTTKNLLLSWNENRYEMPRK